MQPSFCFAMVATLVGIPIAFQSHSKWFLQTPGYVQTAYLLALTNTAFNDGSKHM
jgi:hypothetical protein